jgi:hypothetical protein
MSGSIYLEYDCAEIQAAMAVSLLRFKNANNLTYKQIGKVIEREPQSVQQYICSDTEMPASCWIKLTGQWPELADRLEYNLHAAEKDFLASQHKLNLQPPSPETRAA